MDNYQKVYLELAYLINKELYELKEISYSTYKYTENNIILKLGKQYGSI